MPDLNASEWSERLAADAACRAGTYQPRSWSARRWNDHDNKPGPYNHCSDRFVQCVTTRCKYCGASNLRWHEMSPDRWRLVSESGALHSCAERARKVIRHIDGNPHNNLVTNLTQGFVTMNKLDNSMPLHVNLCTLDLTGLQHHDYALKAKSLDVGDVLTLQAQPNNPVDQEAVAVLFDQVQIGWLPRAHSEAKAIISKMLRAEVQLSAVVLSHDRGRSVRVVIYMLCDR